MGARDRDRAAFARGAALDEVGKAAVEASVDRFIAAAEEVGANVAASPPANRAAGASLPAPATDLIAQLGEAYRRAYEELNGLAAGGGAGAPMLSLGRRLPPDLRQRLLLLSGWLPEP